MFPWLLQGQQNGKVVPREPTPGGVTWTGDGFTEVKDNTALEYAVTNVPYTGEYNILVRYEPKVGTSWVVCTRLRAFPPFSFSLLTLSPIQGYTQGTGELFVTLSAVIFNSWYRLSPLFTVESKMNITCFLSHWITFFLVCNTITWWFDRSIRFDSKQRLFALSTVNFNCNQGHK